jgi:uncharacterized protein YidB (DUF937 family)
VSPIVLALLGLLAYKAFKGRGGQAAPGPEQGAPVPRSGTATAGAPGGGLGDLLGGLFGGRSAAGPAGSGASLNDLLRGGLGGHRGGKRAERRARQPHPRPPGERTWRDGRVVGAARPQSADPAQRPRACARRRYDALSRQTGMNRDDLLEQLSRHLPNFVDQLTPQGRLPTASRMV